MIAGTYVVSIMHEFPSGDEVKIVASDAGKSWIWVVLWVVLALGAPVAVISSLWFLGPVAANILERVS